MLCSHLCAIEMCVEWLRGNSTEWDGFILFTSKRNTNSKLTKKTTAAVEGDENSNWNLFHSLKWEWKAFARDNIPFVRMYGVSVVEAAAAEAAAAATQEKKDVRDVSRNA